MLIFKLFFDVIYILMCFCYSWPIQFDYNYDFWDKYILKYSTII